MLKEKFIEQLRAGKLNNYLQEETVNFIVESDKQEVAEVIDELTSVPIVYSKKVISSDLFRLYFVFAWQQVFEQINLRKNSPAVLEIASGSSDPVPQALDIYAENNGKYVSANLNKILTAGLRQKTADFEIDISIIEDYGINLEKYFEPGFFDITAFHHAVNDIIQTIIADKTGIDTINNSWMDILPEMVKNVVDYYQKGKLQEVAGEEFLKQITVCNNLLKPGGYLVFNTHVYQVDLDCGYPLELYGNFVEIARKWIKGSELNLQEEKFADFDEKWWLFFKKV